MLAGSKLIKGVFDAADSERYAEAACAPLSPRRASHVRDYKGRRARCMIKSIQSKSRQVRVIYLTCQERR